MSISSESNTSTQPILISTPSQLQACVAQLLGGEFVAVDTEFVREQTYFPQLCLIQLGDGDRQYCVDALAVTDLNPLSALLDAPGLIKLFHAASQDLEIFVRLFGRCPTPLFDTQIAAAMLGLGDQLGYAGLVEKLCGVKLDKSLSRTNWARRPLSAPELAYAAADVDYLARMYPQLRQRLHDKGRLPWLEQEGQRQAVAERYQAHPEQEWKRLKGLAKLDALAQHTAAALATWRERRAMASDRPRKWILADDVLYRLAERRPQDMAQLQALTLLPPATLHKHGEALLALINQVDASAARQPLLGERLPEAEHKACFKRLSQGLREIAGRLQVPSALLANRADLERLATQGAAADIPLLSGWRAEVAGRALLAER